ncbi:MAG: TetR/AcrR family transcriptional regulator [Myxococcales bacterium]|nr:TetR/AcrR family transcriptional regulator [Myxococcales bacterium]
MSNPSSEAPRLRADAARNRERLIEAAKEVFGEAGATASLEAVARRAGVGIGTLYRHFESREALVGAVYQREIDRLVEAAERGSPDGPRAAIRAWLHLFVDYIAAKKVLVSAMSQAPSSLEAIMGAVKVLLDRAIEAGEVRADLRPEDLMHALAGLAYAHDRAGWRESALRLIDVFVAGLAP